jgi:putative iron-only hydrogenase system regulator
LQGFSEQKEGIKYLIEPSSLLEGFFIGRAFMDKRIGVVAIVVENIQNAEKVNNILHGFSNIIVGRMGVPYREKGVSVISIIVDGTTDEISALTGKLGKIEGINVKSALTKI